MLALAVDGLLDKEISQELGVTLNTLRTYWSRIRGKVGDVSRSALAVAFIEHSSTTSEDFDAELDWEIDLLAGMWRRVSDRPFPLPPSERREMPLEEIFSFFHPDDLPHLRKMLADIEWDETSAFSYRARLIGHEGQAEASAFVRVVRDDSGRAVRLLGRRTPMHDLKEPDIRSILVGHWTRDLRSGEFTGDDGFRTIFGIEGDVPDLREAAFKRFHPDELNHTRNFVSDAVAAGRTHARSTHRLLSTDGSFRWVTTDIIIQFDEDRPLKVLGTVIAFN